MYIHRYGWNGIKWITCSATVAVVCCWLAAAVCRYEIYPIAVSWATTSSIISRSVFLNNPKHKTNTESHTMRSIALMHYLWKCTLALIGLVFDMTGVMKCIRRDELMDDCYEIGW